MQNMIRNMTIAVLATGLAACEAQNAEDTNVMTGGADTMAQAGVDSLAQQQEGMGERMEFEFQPVNNSEASGEVYATPAEGRTTIILTINAADTAQGQRHMAHIHAGTCENIGQVVAPLEAVTTVSGEGTSTTLLGQDFETFADGWEITDYAVKGSAKRLPPEANLVEALVSRLQSELLPGHEFTPGSYNEEVLAVLEGIGNSCRRTVSEEELNEMRVRLMELMAKWRGLEPGESLEMIFSLFPA